MEFFEWMIYVTSNNLLDYKFIDDACWWTGPAGVGWGVKQKHRQIVIGR